MKVKTFPY
jgi:hypothetical protein